MGKKIVLLLLLFQDLVTCSYSTATERRNCEFTLSDGNLSDFNEHIRKFGECSKKYDVPRFTLRMQNYNIPAFPNRTFSNLGYLEQFTLILENSRIALLSPLPAEQSAFLNLKFKSAVIDVGDSDNLNGWQWSVLHSIAPESGRHFEINLIRSKLVFLHPDFGKVAKSRLTVIRILKCRLRWLGENVFERLHDLKTLELRGNVIQKIERSHLPKKAPHLKSLDLGNNQLSDLPLNIFSDLHINNVYLDGNNLKVLKEEIGSILQSKSFLYISGVLWPCNCESLQQLLRTDLDYVHEYCYMENSQVNIHSAYQQLCDEEKSSFLDSEKTMDVIKFSTVD